MNPSTCGVNSFCLWTYEFLYELYDDNLSLWDKFVHSMDLLVNLSTLQTGNNSSFWNELVHFMDLLIYLST